MKMKFNYLTSRVSLFVLFMMVIGVNFISCDENDDNESLVTSADIAEIRSIVESGEWMITFYFDTDSEETSDFNGFVFSFDPNGTLTAVNGSIEIMGSWSITDSDSSDDDSPDSDIDFNIRFNSPPDFEELSDDWDIEDFSTNRIALIDVSGGNGGTDRVVFERN